MSLLLMESFDGYASVAEMSERGWSGDGSLGTGRNSQGWVAASSNTLQISIPRTEENSNTTSLQGTNFGGVQIFIGFAFKTSSLPSSTEQIMTFPALGNQFKPLQLTPAGALSFLSFSTPNGVIAANTFAYIELMYLADGTGATRRIRVEGILHVDATNVGGSGSQQPAFAVRLGGVTSNWGSITRTYDDFYLSDDRGPAPLNGFLGDSIVRCIRPNGNGVLSEFTGNDGNSVDNYALVDEQSTNDSDYVQANEDGLIDTYTMEDIPDAAPWKVGAIQVQTRGVWLNGLRDLASRVKVGANDPVERYVPLSNSYSSRRDVLPFRHDDLAWEISDVNSFEIGVKTPLIAPYTSGTNWNSGTATTSLSVPLPASSRAGDMLWAHMACRSPFAAITAPAGWTSELDQTHGVIRMLIWRREVEIGETGPYVWNFDANQHVVLAVSNFRPVDTADPVDGIATVTHNANGGTTPVISPTSEFPTVAHFMCLADNGDATMGSSRPFPTSAVYDVLASSTSSPSASILLLLERGKNAVDLPVRAKPFTWGNGAARIVTTLGLKGGATV